MATLRITPSQRDKLMNHPSHYNFVINYIDKEGVFEIDCEYSEISAIKKVIDS